MFETDYKFIHIVYDYTQRTLRVLPVIMSFKLEFFLVSIFIGVDYILIGISYKLQMLSVLVAVTFGLLAVFSMS